MAEATSKQTTRYRVNATFKDGSELSTPLLEKERAEAKAKELVRFPDVEFIAVTRVQTDTVWSYLAASGRVLTPLDIR